jgi:peptide deformylase
LQIVQYPHPTLRHKSKPIARIDRELKGMVSEMFDLMYAAKGIGLAANQVDLPLQLFILNLTGSKEEGEELVFLNPVVSAPRGVSEAEEGCLSLVGLNANVVRPEQVRVTAYDLSGKPIDLTVNGLFARAVQHEFDHLQGVLFIDRVSELIRRQLATELEDFEIDFHSKQSTGTIPETAALQARIKELEAKYC